MASVVHVTLAREARLPRTLGVPDAVLLGLGSILGTGIFVSIGIAAGITGSSVVIAVALAALVATFNGLSSAALAANHPVSGGTYEYGYRHLTPSLGVTAGWLFLCAKTASAATAALGVAGYLHSMTGAPGTATSVPVALGVIGLLTLLVAGGMKRSSRTNAAIVSITLVALFAFIVAGAPSVLVILTSPDDSPFLDRAHGTSGLLHATALMFVAYTGYGRVATLGEEVRDPARSVPRAVMLSLAASMLLHLAVALVAVSAVGAPRLASLTTANGAPLAAIAAGRDQPTLALLMALGAITAMLGVLLNLLLGLSRVLLAMARRGDMPRGLAVLDAAGSPRRAVLVTGAVIAAVATVGDVRSTWSLSAFTVLVYYAITNLAALQLPAATRWLPRFVPACGLASCMGLAGFVERRTWVVGLGLIAVGIAWHLIAQRVQRRPHTEL